MKTIDKIENQRSSKSPHEWRTFSPLPELQFQAPGCNRVELGTAYPESRELSGSLCT